MQKEKKFPEMLPNC